MRWQLIIETDKYRPNDEAILELQMKSILRSLTSLFSSNESSAALRCLALHIYMASPRGALS